VLKLNKMENIFNLLALSLFSALVGFGFNKMLEPDMIFNWYKEFLIRVRAIGIYKPIIYWRKYRAKKNYYYMRTLAMMNKEDMYYKSRFLSAITHPLGLCIVCNTCWIGIGFTFITHPFQFSTIYTACFVGAASAGIALIFQLIYKCLHGYLNSFE